MLFTIDLWHRAGHLKLWVTAIGVREGILLGGAEKICPPRPPPVTPLVMAPNGVAKPIGLTNQI